LRIRRKRIDIPAESVDYLNRMISPTTESNGAHGLRTADFPNTFIAQILVSLDDPDHWVKLAWAGPNAQSQEAGPFRSSPGAGLEGINCDDVEASQKDGSRCTPKGTHLVQGFANHLNDDPRATHVTWFVEEREIGLHYYPSVPPYAGSHGCVRLETDHAAQLIFDNAVEGVTSVIVEGTWTKPPHQWPRSS
jgi:hypothetical protein